jgi:pantetheine-phosphate adenylyltransferase
MKENNASIIIRGMRAISDFEQESQLALMNKKLAPEIETIFMITGLRYSYLNSSIVKEIASLEGCVKQLVPETVEDKLRKKFFT